MGWEERLSPWRRKITLDSSHFLSDWVRIKCSIMYICLVFCCCCCFTLCQRIQAMVTVWLSKSICEWCWSVIWVKKWIWKRFTQTTLLMSNFSYQRMLSEMTFGNYINFRTEKLHCHKHWSLNRPSTVDMISYAKMQT